ncbi:MAG: bifunctional oligoribonuclease/PAP phosphatase NrnA [Erysipelotrichales bacterium]|nr:bifunctional oligoribonuclease/PAP phosphatase NrnA [Erysipelotrichales bacterium]
MEKKIYQKIVEHDIITIFGHVMPDGDCYGSQLGFKEAIIATFPNKQVYILGTGLPFLFERLAPMDIVDDEVIKKSLAIVLDVGNTERVEDQRFLMAKEIIKIDHHIFVHKYGDLELVDESAIACAQIVTRIIEKNNMSITKLGAEALMLGITTDSGRFMYGQTGEDTFRAASFLMSKGVDLRSLYDTLYASNLNDIKFKGYFLNSFIAEDGLCYITMTLEEVRKLNVDSDYAASQVNLISGIKGYPIWATFVEKDNGLIRCELRSQNPSLNVQLVAKKYGGGGHIQAAGCRVKSFELVDSVINDLKLLIKGEFKDVE